MSLFRASFWNALSISARLGSALVLNKTLALVLGPSGYAVIGQFQNGLSIVNSVSATAFQPGVVKGVAEAARSGEERMGRVLETAFTLVVAGSVAVGLVVALGSRPASRLLFERAEYAPVFVLLGVALLPGNAGLLLTSILNGLKAFRQISMASAASSLISLLLAVALTLRFGLIGTLAALAVAPALSLASTWLIARQPLRQTPGLGRLGLHRREAASLGGFALMGLTTAVVTPLSQIAIRRMVVDGYGLDAAGAWDALNKTSTLYMAFFNTTMSVYYLPRVAESRSWPELRGEMLRLGAVAAPLMGCALILLVLLRAPLVDLLFSTKFRVMTELIPWQALGDFLKVLSALASWVLIGRGKTVLFVLSEIGFFGLQVVLTRLFIGPMGLAGAPVAYAVDYAVYGCALYLLLLSTPSRRASIFR